jgi:branched-subunit amino acid aminotransferase/4-amino-4-deoxychorismate lyase
LLQSIDDTLAWYRLASLHWPDHAKRLGRSAEYLRGRVEPWLVRFMALTDALSDVLVRPPGTVAEPTSAHAVLLMDKMSCMARCSG